MARPTRKTKRSPSTVYSPMKPMVENAMLPALTCGDVPFADSQNAQALKR